ncbi:MAG: N-acyl-D-amino-acid deacylase [Candidatus Poriferisodalaceae bacterium]|jgi:N-acyl-D-amino-acid deacylase|tara:strand:+ start:2997 stop:4691 length:1695 start_codon:yes stop_codon:yes gene_type:complete
MVYDIVIKDGLIFDGTGAPRVRGDVGIIDGRVAAIGRVDSSQAKQIIDATGMHVAPGFVDLHTHYDAQIFWDPYCTLSGWHGITSVAIGNCGFGFAPVDPDMREYAMKSMTRVEAIPYDSMAEGMPWDWTTFPEYLDSLERTPKAMNILPYVPIGPMLIQVLGLADAKAGRMPTASEHDALSKMVHAAMDAGGCGWSAQRLPPTGPSAVQRDWDGTPMPTDMMNDETARVLAQVLADRNQGVIQMTLTTNDIKHDLAHLEEIASISGRPLLHNVVQAFEDRPHIHKRQIEWLERCRERGIPVYGQGVTSNAGFTFTLEDWNLYDDSEDWMQACMGTKEERLAKFADPSRRQGLKDNLPATATAPLGTVTILSPRSDSTERYREMSVAQAAELSGKHEVDIMLDIAVEDGLDTLFFVAPPQNNSDHLKDIVTYPHMLFGVSDGGAHTKFLTAGRYPTETLTEQVRDNQWITYEEAHRKLSALPAQLAGFQDRGVIRKGSPADIIVYDPVNLKVLPMEVVHDLPGGEWRRIQKASGYQNVIINGEITIENDQQTNTYSGKLLRNGI